MDLLVRSAGVRPPSRPNNGEGCGKRGNPKFQPYLTIAAGSTNELEYDLNFVVLLKQRRRVLNGIFH